MNRKLILLIPFIIYTLAIVFCWYQLLFEDYVPTVKHTIALVLVIINIVVYFWNYNYGLILTGLMLVLGTFSLISISIVQLSGSFTIAYGDLAIDFPGIHYLSFLLLIMLCIFNYRLIKTSWVRILKFSNQD